MSSLSQNRVRRTKSQDGRAIPPGFVGDSRQFVLRGCWSGEDCLLSSA